MITVPPAFFAVWFFLLLLSARFPLLLVLPHSPKPRCEALLPSLPMPTGRRKVPGAKGLYSWLCENRGKQPPPPRKIPPKNPRIFTTTAYFWDQIKQREQLSPTLCQLRPLDRNCSAGLFFCVYSLCSKWFKPRHFIRWAFRIALFFFGGGVSSSYRLSLYFYGIQTQGLVFVRVSD